MEKTLLSKVEMVAELLVPSLAPNSQVDDGCNVTPQGVDQSNGPKSCPPFFPIKLMLCLLLLGLTACVSLESAAETAADPNAAITIQVDVDSSRGEISPYIFGTNYGPWVSLRPETLPLAEAGGFTSVRYPGGEFGDKNKLRSYQIDQLVDLSRRMGAEPYIHVRLPGSSPEEAAEAVQYANIDNDYAIKFWSIGNEPSLYAGAEIGKGWIRDVVWDTTYFNEQWRLYAEAMKEVDPSIVLMGPELHQWSNAPGIAPTDPSGRDWMTEFLKANGDMVDVVTFHRYPFPNNAERSAAKIPDLRANPTEWESIVPAIRELIRETTGRDMPIGVTEINSHWSLSLGGEGTSDSFYHAIWWADVLARMVNQRVDYVNQFVLTGNALGLIGKYDALPSYYVYPMYKGLGDQLLASASGNPMVSSVAALRDDGKITILLVNRDSESKRMILDASIGEIEEALLFDKDHNAESVDPNSILQPTANPSLALPAESIIFLLFSPN